MKLGGRYTIIVSVILVVIILMIVGIIMVLKNMPKVNQLDDGLGPQEELGDIESYIQVASNFSGYNLILENKFDLENLIQKWDILGKEYEYDDTKTGESGLQNIDFLLVDNSIDDEEAVYGEYTFVRLLLARIQVYFSPTEEMLNSPDADNIITTNFLGALYKTTHPEVSDEEIEIIISEALDELEKQGGAHFVVTKE